MDFDLSNEQATWKKIVHEFAEKVLRPKAREVDEKEEFNWDAARKGGPVGLTGMSISEEYGGSNGEAYEPPASAPPAPDLLHGA